MPVGQQAINAVTELEALAQRYGIPSLWHITSRENVAAILSNGLMSRHRVLQRQVPLVDISEATVQDHRVAKGTRNGLTLHDHVPLYFRARNPMLFCRRNRNASLCLLEIDTRVCLLGGVVFSDGNAASGSTQFYDHFSDLRFLDWQALDAVYWSNVPDGKRKRCAEVLVPHHVPVSLVHRVHTATAETCGWLQLKGIDAVHSPTLFF